MMRLIDKAALEALRAAYPKGCRVILDAMNDPYAPPVGTMGTVEFVDDIGTIHISWENGSGLGVVPGVDRIHKANGIYMQGDEKMRNETEGRIVRVCPICGSTYTERPALSRKDNETDICPDCGIMEALESMGVCEEERAVILEAIHRTERKKENEG